MLPSHELSFPLYALLTGLGGAAQGGLLGGAIGGGYAYKVRRDAQKKIKRGEPLTLTEKRYYFAAHPYWKGIKQGAKKGALWGAGLNLLFGLPIYSSLRSIDDEFRRVEEAVSSARERASSTIGEEYAKTLIKSSIRNFAKEHFPGYAAPFIVNKVVSNKRVLDSLHKILEEQGVEALNRTILNEVIPNTLAASAGEIQESWSQGLEKIKNIAENLASKGKYEAAQQLLELKAPLITADSSIIDDTFKKNRALLERFGEKTIADYLSDPKEANLFFHRIPFLEPIHHPEFELPFFYYNKEMVRDPNYFTHTSLPFQLYAAHKKGELSDVAQRILNIASGKLQEHIQARRAAGLPYMDITPALLGGESFMNINMGAPPSSLKKQGSAFYYYNLSLGDLLR